MRRIAVPVLLLAALGGTVGAADPFPYDLVVDVRQDTEEGKGILTDELRINLLLRLASNSCFRNVAPAGDGTTLTDEHLVAVFRIVDLLDEMRYETSMAQRNDPNASPEVQRAVTAYVELEYVLELETADGAVVRSKYFRATRSYRPRLHEDPRPQAHRELIEDVVRNARRWTCRGSAKKLARDIAKAESAAAETSR